ncbi:MAG: hypothetical protein FJ296_05225, partial [Planctomycetes bacterium]|nr:hypothetical protein [Planctomycetota bacterium]
MRPRGLLFVAGGLTLILALAAGLLLLQPADEEPLQSLRRARADAEDGERQLPSVAAADAAPALLALSADAAPDAPAQ